MKLEGIVCEEMLPVEKPTISEHQQEPKNRSFFKSKKFLLLALAIFTLFLSAALLFNVVQFTSTAVVFHLPRFISDKIGLTTPTGFESTALDDGWVKYHKTGESEFAISLPGGWKIAGIDQATSDQLINLNKNDPDWADKNNRASVEEVFRNRAKMIAYEEMNDGESTELLVQKEPVPKSMGFDRYIQIQMSAMPKPKDCIRDKYTVSDVERCAWEIDSGSASKGQEKKFLIVYFILNERGAYFLSFQSSQADDYSIFDRIARSFEWQ